MQPECIRNIAYRVFASCESIMGAMRLKNRKQHARLTVDSVSAGLASGTILMWLLNAADIGLFSPLAMNASRALKGLPAFPMHPAKSIWEALWGFDRWWFVLVMATALTIYFALASRDRIPKPWTGTVARLAIAFVIFLVLHYGYYLPISATALSEYAGKFLASAASAILFTFAIAPPVGASVRYFME
jgi:hypothetical protein